MAAATIIYKIPALLCQVQKKAPALDEGQVKQAILSRLIEDDASWRQRGHRRRNRGRDRRRRRRWVRRDTRCGVNHIERIRWVIDERSWQRNGDN